jgi:hypothetical protein
MTVTRMRDEMPSEEYQQWMAWFAYEHAMREMKEV